MPSLFIVKGWKIARDFPVGFGQRPKVAIRRTKKARILYMLKGFTRSVTELRSEVIASSIGRKCGFSVQECKLCKVQKPAYYKLIDDRAVLVRLSVNLRKETLLHMVDLYVSYKSNLGMVIKSKDNWKPEEYNLEFLPKLLNEYADMQNCHRTLWQEVAELFCFDALIGGTERHPRNWGMITSSDNQIDHIRVSPAFDNGISLWWNMTNTKDVFNRDPHKFINRARSHIDRSAGKHCNLFEAFEIVLNWKQSKGKIDIKKIQDKLMKLTDKKLKQAVYSLPQLAEFETLPAQLHHVYSYVRLRRNRLLQIIDSAIMR